MQKIYKIFGIVLIITLILIITKKRNNTLNGLYQKEFTEGEAEILVDNNKVKKIRVDYSGWFNPYEQNRTNLIRLTKHTFGVYCIRKKSNNEIVYIGHSSTNLYKALYRHFQKYSDSGKQHRIYYSDRQNYEVCVILTNQKNAYNLERALIKQYKPIDAYMKYENEQLEILTDNIEEFETLEAPF